MNYTQAELARAKYHEDKAQNVFYKSWLEGPQGAGFELMREAHHTDDDIQRAKDHLRATRDVVCASTLESQ